MYYTMHVMAEQGFVQQKIAQVASSTAEDTAGNALCSTVEL